MLTLRQSLWSREKEKTDKNSTAIEGGETTLNKTAVSPWRPGILTIASLPSPRTPPPSRCAGFSPKPCPPPCSTPPQPDTAPGDTRLSGAQKNDVCMLLTVLGMVAPSAASIDSWPRFFLALFFSLSAFLLSSTCIIFALATGSGFVHISTPLIYECTMPQVCGLASSLGGRQAAKAEKSMGDLKPKREQGRARRGMERSKDTATDAHILYHCSFGGFIFSFPSWVVILLAKQS